ncbi:MAG TPA: N-6 DNA methylase [Vicinamibacterales bacterium]|nr:N-6 DNA methylase [Vicinamibacterales bacterium]
MPGITGSLLAGSFIEQVWLPEVTAAGAVNPKSIRQLHRWWRTVERHLGPASGARAVLDIAVLPLITLLRAKVTRMEPHRGGFVGSVESDGGRPLIIVATAWSTDADAAWQDVVRAGRVGGSPWALICGGRSVRIVDASRTWSRRFLEFDLAAAINSERSATVLVAACDAAGSLGPEGLTAIAQRSDVFGVRVCSSLGDGVLDALGGLLGSLRTDARAQRQRPTDVIETYQQAVTIVYRVLFLLFAEARDLVPTWHRVYREAYTIESLCRRSAIRPNARGLWDALQAISRLAHAGCRAGDLTVTPFNGRLFSPRHTPLAEDARVPDAVVGRVVLALATAPGAGGRQRISYADLGVEQLGAVYERVLEYEPVAGAGLTVLTRTSGERKATGSFYTPRAMTEFLVRRALHPLVVGRSVEQILSLRVLDPAMGSGAFLVAACRYLAAAADRAGAAEGPWVSPADARMRRAEFRRIVAQRCVYGVDLNPMAVQLARLSLWLTTLAGNRPLTFLDHHLAAGDSLLGASLHDLARHLPGATKRSQRRPETRWLFDDEVTERMAGDVLPDRYRLALEAGDTPQAVRDKETALAALVYPGAPLARWKQAADLWCAAWFWRDGRLDPRVYADVVASFMNRQPALIDRHREVVTREVHAIAAAHRFFHWELEFPEVFFDQHGRRNPDGGFDAVIGNPPWDMLRSDSGDQDTRDRGKQDRLARLRFFRDAGIYRHQGAGHANRYQLFVERAMQIVRPGGRLALIVPSGLASDHGSGPLRRALFDNLQIDRLLGFDNRETIFPIHRDMKFLLMTGTIGQPTDRLSCAFGRTRADWLDQLPDAAADDPAEARPIVISRALIEQWDREQLAVPLLPQRIDLDILAAASAQAPALRSAHGWGAAFGRELNATEDRAHFVAKKRASADLLQVIDGKHLEPFRARIEQSERAIARDAAASLVPPARTFARQRLAYRDVASATNRVTLIAALLPAGTISTHTVFCLKTALAETAQYCLLALLNSLVVNYLVRLQVTTHVTTALMARLPVPKPAGRAFGELARLARSLEKSGVEADLPSFARINTITAHLYHLTREQYAHVVSTFPLLSQELRQACLAAYLRATPRNGRGTEPQQHRR